MSLQRDILHPSRSLRWTTVLLLLMAGYIFLTGYSATRHSPVFVEGFNLVAGIRFWQTGQNDLFVVNPPLSRMVGTVPVAISGVKTNWDAIDFHDLRPEYTLASDCIEANGQRALWLFTLARWACISFGVLGMTACFLWARDLYGPASGILAAMLWAFSPNILAHGALATADGAAASVGVMSAYVFWRWLQHPAWPLAFASGCALGLVLLTKTTWLILPILWPLLWCTYHAVNYEKCGSHRLREALQLVTILVLGVFMLNAAYHFQGSFRRLGEYEFISWRFGGTAVDTSKFGNRFRSGCLAGLPVPLPEPYVRGIDLQTLDFEKGYKAYLSGQWQSSGSWYYYLYAFAIKTPVGMQCLMVIAFTVTFLHRYRSSSGWCDEYCLLLPALAIAVVVSSQTGLNAHFRYFLPAFPFLFVWTSKIGRAFVPGHSRLATVVVALLAWVVASSLWTYPHSLSYFNEIIGGPRRGRHHLLGSNVDWGQDLLYLKRWLDEHPEVGSPGLAYYGVASPSDVLGIQFVDVPNGPDSDSILQPSELGPQPGWYAISVNLLHDHTKCYAYFCHFQPATTAGYSICVYYITRDEANRVRQELGLPELKPNDAVDGSRLGDGS